MRWVHPLDDKQWKFLIEQLDKAPTVEQKRAIKEAVDKGSKLKVIR